MKRPVFRGCGKADQCGDLKTGIDIGMAVSTFLYNFFTLGNEFHLESLLFFPALFFPVGSDRHGRSGVPDTSGAGGTGLRFGMDLSWLIFLPFF